MSKITRDCSTCKKFKKSIGQCLVLNELVENCWAWTDDKDWLEKVEKAVEEYRGRGTNK